MLFNSLDFAIFIPIVFLLYWFVTSNNLKSQNFLIVCASYIFYGWWDSTFLLLILFSTIIDYTIGVQLSYQQEHKKRKLLLWTSILVNLGFLGFFKYFNFFIENFTIAFSFLGYKLPVSTLNIVLPVGISFYTFQTLSYTIDVYKKNLEPTKDFIAFAAFVSFFPQLVAGPIERATHLLPQFYKKRKFEYELAVDGMHQILWGLFKKIIIADNCAVYANMVFNNSSDYSGSTLVLGVAFFAFQIYGDFSGYSDIAIGVSRLFGFDLMKNFSFPYFSRDIAEFWRRWHISLNTWFRDYLYIPLGGSRGGLKMKIRNTFIIFIVSGFWHGANWTFIVWGALNALYFLPLLLMKNNRNNMETIAKGKLFPTIREFIAVIITFSLTLLAWIFFRANNLSHAMSYLKGIFSKSLFYKPEIISLEVIILFMLMFLFISVEWLQRDKEHALQLSKVKIFKPVKWISYIVIIILLILFRGELQGFIYFQF